MKFELKPLSAEHTARFKKDMQDAFRKGAADKFGDTAGEILPESHIDRSLNTEGAKAFEAVVDGELAGGAIVVINTETQHNHLDFLYVKNGIHSKGIGLKIWEAIEALFPETKVWETVTPYFEMRNIHFYINKCGFHAVEFYCSHHPDPFDDGTEDRPDNGYFDGMFRFEKQMKQ